VLIGPALAHLSFPEVSGAYLATGVLMLALGLSGWVKRCMEAVPMPIVMAMVAGVFLRFGLDLVFAIRDEFWIAAPMAVVFLALSALPRAARVLPPLIAAMIAGAVMVGVLGRFDSSATATLAPVQPNFYQREVHVRRARNVSGHRCRRNHPQHQRGVLGVGLRLCRVMAAGARRLPHYAAGVMR